MENSLKVFGKCTIYVSGEFFGCINKIECSSASYRIGKYAQYPSAVMVEFLPKGKRKPRGLTQTYKPSLVILEGHGHLEPESFYGEPDAAGCQASRYLSHGAEWQENFDASLAAYLTQTGAKVLADFRQHNTSAVSANAPAGSPVL